MMEPHGGRWLAFHVYWRDRLEPVLLHTVAPTVAELERRGAISGFFFIRYWEGGQHVRLRLAPSGAHEDLASQVEAALAARLSSQFGDGGGSTAGIPEGSSVRQVAYEPEVARYGGPVGLPIAESCFEASSRTVLALLARTEDWSVEWIMGIAAALQITAVHAYGLDRLSAAAFLRAMSEDGFMQMFGPGDGSREEPLIARLKAAFEQTYGQQRSRLQALIDRLWRCSEEGTLDALQEWYAAMHETGSELRRAWESGLLEGHHHLRWKQGGEFGATCWPLAGILFDLAHMTNNRLGLSNYDEAYLAYVLSRALEEATPSC